MVDQSFAEDTIKVGSKKRGRKPKQKMLVEGIQATKEYSRYLKSHDEEQAEAFLAKDNDELKKMIAYCLVEIADETEQVEENENYKKAKEDLKVFDDALKEAIKPLKDTISLATTLLRDRGDVFRPDSLAGAIQGLKDAGVTIEAKKNS